MKVRDSGMPEEGWWSTFFDPERILRLFGLDGNVIRRDRLNGERHEGNDPE